MSIRDKYWRQDRLQIERESNSVTNMSNIPGSIVIYHHQNSVCWTTCRRCKDQRRTIRSLINRLLPFKVGMIMRWHSLWRWWGGMLKSLPPCSLNPRVKVRARTRCRLLMWRGSLSVGTKPKSNSQPEKWQKRLVVCCLKKWISSLRTK